MNLSRLTRLALVAALALPAVAQAQSETLKFEGVKYAGGDKVGSAQTGPYEASRFPFSTPATTFDIYCIDRDHAAPNGMWDVRYITFSEAIAGGTFRTEALRQLGSEKAWGIADLRAAAYLSTQFNLGNKNQWDNIHGAIWSMFSNDAASQAYIGDANAAKAMVGGNSAWDSYLLAFDNNAFAPNWTTNTTLKQGFIVDDDDVIIRVVTPEPSTYVLMGAGLLAVGFVSRRRRSV